MSKIKKRILISGCMLTITAAIFFTACLLFYKNPEPTEDMLYDSNATLGILPGTDLEARRKELQDALDKSMIAFSINMTPVFPSGTDEGNLLIENPGNNAKLLKVIIKLNGTNEEIFTTKLIKPGSYIESAKLDKVLEKGVYEATAYFSAYTEDTGEYIGETGAGILLTVEQ